MSDLVNIISSRKKGYVPSSQATLRTIQVEEQPRAASESHELRRRRFMRFPSKPKILLLEPFYPASAKWGSLKVEQGFLPPLGLISIHRWLKEKGHDVAFIDT